MVSEADIFPIVGSITGCLLFASPVYGILQDRKANKLTTDPIPFTTNLMAAMFFGLYGALKPDAYVYCQNVIAVALSLFLVVTGFQLAEDRFTKGVMECVVVIGGIVLFVFIGLVGTPTYITDKRVRMDILGYTCIACGVMLYTAPLLLVYTIIKTRDASMLSFPLGVTMQVHAVCWTVYGVMQNDPVIYVPNVLGASFTLVNLSLQLVFWKGPITKELSTPEVEHPKKPELPTLLSRTANLTEDAKPADVEAHKVIASRV